MTSERTNEPSTTVHETARHNNKSPCTDGEVGRWVDLCRSEAASLEAAHEAGKKPLAPLQAPHLLRGVADLLTRLSAERATVAEVLEPFARAAKSTSVTEARQGDAWSVTVERPISFMDFRRAAELHATLSGERI